MKLTVFQSDKGDCLLVTGADSKRMLVDGGMRSSFKKHVAASLGKLRSNDAGLDLVYVSHIDQDHISGILQLMDDLVAWRVHDFQSAHGNPGHPKPKVVRPPDVAAIWHNAFHEVVGQNSGPIEDMLAATASVLSASDDPSLLALAGEHRELATSTGEAIQLSRRIGDAQLNIDLNKEFGGKLMMVRAGMPKLALGGMKAFLLGPFAQDLTNLRKEWNDWLNNSKAALKKIQDEAAKDASELGNSVEQLVTGLINAADQLGDRTKVTAPNLASLMVLLEESGKTVLLSGDGHWADILKGLRHHNLLGPNDNIHLNVLKGQHHGSENNFDEDFCRAVTADNYIFCGNGAHKNPDPRVIELVANSRFGNSQQRSKHPKRGNKFTLWFNSSSTASEEADNKRHMRKIEDLAQKLVARSQGQMDARFLSQSSFDLNV